MDPTRTESKAAGHVFGDAAEEDLTLEHLGYQPGMASPFLCR